VTSEAVPRELVSDDINGFRVLGFDLDLYARRLACLFTNNDLWKRISATALRTVTGYSHVRIAEQYERLIDEAQGNKGAR
jgi:glycosyltransferase involved in cell wall biosynthesis